MPKKRVFSSGKCSLILRCIWHIVLYHSVACVRGEIAKYKVLFQLVSQVVEYEYVNILHS